MHLRGASGIRQALNPFRGKPYSALWGRRLGWGFETENDFVGARQIQLVARGALDVTGVGLQGFDFGLLPVLEHILLFNLTIQSRNLLLHAMPLVKQWHEEEDDTEPDDRDEDVKAE
jgi:hypothetical protein